MDSKYLARERTRVLPSFLYMLEKIQSFIILLNMVPKVC